MDSEHAGDEQQAEEHGGGDEDHTGPQGVAMVFSNPLFRTATPGPLTGKVL